MSAGPGVEDRGRRACARGHVSGGARPRRRGRRPACPECTIPLDVVRQCGAAAPRGWKGPWAGEVRDRGPGPVEKGQMRKREVRGTCRIVLCGGLDIPERLVVVVCDEC